MFTRRGTIGGLAAMAAAPSLLAAAPARSGSRPARLRQGDKVGLIAPASSDDDPVHLEAALATVRGMGLAPRLGTHVSDRFGYLSGTDRDRAAGIAGLAALFAEARYDEAAQETLRLHYLEKLAEEIRIKRSIAERAGS